MKRLKVDVSKEGPTIVITRHRILNDGSSRRIRDSVQDSFRISVDLDLKFYLLFKSEKEKDLFLKSFK